MTLTTISKIKNDEELNAFVLNDVNLEKITEYHLKQLSSPIIRVLIYKFMDKGVYPPLMFMKSYLEKKDKDVNIMDMINYQINDARLKSITYPEDYLDYISEMNVDIKIRMSILCEIFKFFGKQDSPDVKFLIRMLNIYFDKCLNKNSWCNGRGDLMVDQNYSFNAQSDHEFYMLVYRYVHPLFLNRHFRVYTHTETDVKTISEKMNLDESLCKKYLMYKIIKLAGTIPIVWGVHEDNCLTMLFKDSTREILCDILKHYELEEIENSNELTDSEAKILHDALGIEYRKSQCSWLNHNMSTPIVESVFINRFKRLPKQFRLTLSMSPGKPKEYENQIIKNIHDLIVTHRSFEYVNSIIKSINANNDYLCYFVSSICELDECEYSKRMLLNILGKLDADKSKSLMKYHVNILNAIKNGSGGILKNNDFKISLLKYLTRFVHMPKFNSDFFSLIVKTFKCIPNLLSDEELNEVLLTKLISIIFENPEIVVDSEMMERISSACPIINFISTKLDIENIREIESLKQQLANSKSKLDSIRNTFKSIIDLE